eukprot:scaffold82220_cov32-Prasinocladus_malaysianus.AAC.1
MRPGNKSKTFLRYHVCVWPSSYRQHRRRQFQATPGRRYIDCSSLPASLGTSSVVFAATALNVLDDLAIRVCWRVNSYDTRRSSVRVMSSRQLAYQYFAPPRKGNAQWLVRPDNRLSRQ